MVAELNPFVYDRPVGPSELIDRDGEASQLVVHAEGGHNSLVSAPRRYGKTSLLRRILADAEQVGLNTVYVDFDGVLSLADVAGRIAEGYDRDLRGLAGRAWQAVKRSLRLKVSYEDLAVQLELGQGAEETLGGLLDLPARIYEKTAVRTLVVYDEFQAVLAAAENADALVRSRIQHHRESASYIFAGSEQSLLRRIFAARERPLYGQARILRLGPLADEDLADHIGAQFDRTKRDPGDSLSLLLDLVCGHPQRAMLVAHFLWEKTPSGEAADLEAWFATLEAVFAQLHEAFRATWDGLSDVERRVLGALASREDTLLSKAALERWGLGKSSAAAARDRLIERGHIERGAGDQARIVDPLFGAWITAGRRPLTRSQ